MINQKKLLYLFCVIVCILFALTFLLSSCTISLNNVGTCGGKAEDVIDETQSNEPNVSPNLDLDIPLAMPENLPHVPKIVLGKNNKKD